MRALVLLLLASCVTVRISAPRSPIYDCQAEDGSGRVVRIAYAGDPVRLSEGLADEPGGLWSCYRAVSLDGAAVHESSISEGAPVHADARALTDLRTAAETTNAATCSPYPWRPLNLQECR